MDKMDRDEILKKGEVEIRVKRAGMFQRLPFKVVREKTLGGPVPFLTTDRFIDLPELMRIAEETQLPINSPTGKVFPKGKKSSDFAGL